VDGSGQGPGKGDYPPKPLAGKVNLITLSPAASCPAIIFTAVRHTRVESRKLFAKILAQV
jgi:hypothetical protein